MDIVILLSIVNVFVFPDFHFTDNPMLRFILLGGFFLLTSLFYGYLRGLSNEKDNIEDKDVEDKDIEESNNELITGESNDLTKKIVVIGIVGFFITVVGLFVVMNATLLFGWDDVENPLSYRDSNIFLKYPGNWQRQYGTDADLTLFATEFVFSIYCNTTNGCSLDEFTNNFISDFDNSNKTVLFKNTTTIDGLKANDIGLKLYGSDHDLYYGLSFYPYNRLLIFESNNTYYVFRFFAMNLEDIVMKI